jgi:hypothetical protein
LVKNESIVDPGCTLQDQAIDDECTRIVHSLDVEPKMQCFQAPLLAMSDGLASGCDVGLGEE